MTTPVAARMLRTGLALAVLLPLAGRALIDASAQPPPPAPQSPPGAGAAPSAKKAPAAPPSPAASPEPAKAGPVRLVPRARRLSTYTLQVRYEIGTKEVAFDAPPAYRDSFAFWTGRMKGNKRMEIYEFQTVTQDVREDGLVPFRRTLPRYNLEMIRGGQPYTPYGPFLRDMMTLTWEGTLHPAGHIKEIRTIEMPDNKEIAETALTQIEVLFPRLDGPRDISAGSGFQDVVTVPFPSRLNILGLENIRLQITRDYTLRQIRGEHAVFDQKTTYLLDPATPPEATETTCVVGGGGAGETTFDLRRGVFFTTTGRTLMTVDIEAPLRPLPEQEQAGPPGKAKAHLELDIMMSGQQTVKRVWGEEED